MDPRTEALARATIEIPKAPKPKKAEVRAVEIRTRVGESKTLDNLTSAIESTKPLETGNEASILDANFGTIRKPDASKELSEPGSKDRHDRAEKGLERSRETVSGTIAGTEKDVVVKELNSTFDTLPVYKDIFAGLNPADRPKVIDALLKNPDFLLKLREQYGSLTAPDKALVDIVTDARKKFNEVEATFKRKDKEYTDGDGDLTKLKVRRHELTTAGQAPHDELMGLKFDATGNPRDLSKELRDAQSNKSSLSANLAAINKAKNDLLASGTSLTDSQILKIDGDISSLTPTLSQAESDVSSAINAQKRRTLLEEELAGLPDNINNLEQKLQGLDLERGELKKLELAAQAELSLATINRAGDEENYASQIEVMPRNALIALLNDKLAEAKRVDDELIEAEKSKSLSDDETKVWDQLKKRWVVPRKPNMINRSDTAPNQVAVKDDLAVYRVGGEQAVLRRMLESSGLTKQQITERMADSAFVQKMGPEVTARVMREAMRLNLLKSSDADWIINTPGGSAAIEKAKDLRKEVKDLETSLRNDGVIKEKIAELLKGERGLNKLGILMLIFAMVPGIFGVKEIEDSLRTLDMSNK